MNIGFVGLGLMGRPMVINLLKCGYRVRLWARRPEAMQPLIDQGATGAKSAADTLTGADLFITMVADAPDVEEVHFGPSGAIHGLPNAKPGLIAIDMSTIAPSAAKAIAERWQSQGIDFLDAPVSGGEAGAIAATLSIMAGGSRRAFEHALPAFTAMAQNITHIGEAGSGQIAKACNQIVVSQTMVAISEALMLARNLGVDPVKVREALLGGFAGSKILEMHGQRMLKRDFKPGFKAWMMQKDLDIVTRTAYGEKLALPGAALAAQLYNAMAGSGMGEDDVNGVLRLLERLSGLQDDSLSNRSD